MYFKILQIGIPFIWFGMIGAISFMETPLKFRAPNMTLALGLGVGRLVFYALNKVELVLAILFVVALLSHRPAGRFAIGAAVVVISLLLLQTVWLLPALDVRAEAVISGSAQPFSYTHIIYIVFEALKFILLFALGVNLAKEHLKFE